MPISKHNVSYVTHGELTIRQAAQFGPDSSRWRVVSGLGDVPKNAGVYAVYHDAALVYIGSSHNLRSRLTSVFRQRFEFFQLGVPRCAAPEIEVVVKVSPSRRLGDWLMREYRLIVRLR